MGADFSTAYLFLVFTAASRNLQTKKRINEYKPVIINDVAQNIWSVRYETNFGSNAGPKAKPTVRYIVLVLININAFSICMQRNGDSFHSLSENLCVPVKKSIGLLLLFVLRRSLRYEIYLCNCN